MKCIEPELWMCLFIESLEQARLYVFLESSQSKMSDVWVSQILQTYALKIIFQNIAEIKFAEI